MKKAFSLIELMIVIVIMGLMYTLSIQSFSNTANKLNKITLLNLKEYIQGQDYQKSVRFLCLDDCKSCDILIDGVKQNTIENILDDSVLSYEYDFISGTRKALIDVYFNSEGTQEDVCFSYTVDKQGVGDQVLVVYKNNVYDFTTYLSPTKKYNSLESAIDAKEKLIREVE